MISGGRNYAWKYRKGLELLRRQIGRSPVGNFQIVFPDASSWSLRPGEPAFSITIRHPRALRGIFIFPTTRSVGEGYVRGDFDIEGDWDEAMDAADRIIEDCLSIRFLAAIGWAFVRASGFVRGMDPDRAKSRAENLGEREKTRRAISTHYDKPAGFWKLWLDAGLVYTSAYFDTPEADLQDAQEAKLDMVCRKLGIKEGDRFFDLGCGWGALMVHAAERYGAECVGVTLSAEQADYCDSLFRNRGLEGRCRVELRDYRDFEDPNGFNRVASIEAMESVLPQDLAHYFQKVAALLRPGGVFLNQSVTSAEPTMRRRFVQRGKTFVESRVFPDHTAYPLDSVLEKARLAGLETIAVEGLRHHYALTLRHWLTNLVSARDEVSRGFGTGTFRLYLLYMARAKRSFEEGRLSVHQCLFVRSGEEATSQQKGAEAAFDPAPPKVIAGFEGDRHRPRA